VAIILFTDFGSRDLYVGQVKAVLAHRAPRVLVIDALHDAPAFGIEASAHLLAALAPRYPRGSVFCAVVDPGVGGAREAIVLRADGRTFVGPDNGLLSVLWARASRRSCRRIVWRPAALSASFHGRDLFAPVAAALATRHLPGGWTRALRRPGVLLGGEDRAAVIYIDHYGNAMTGLRADGHSPSARLRVGRHRLAFARVFEAAPRGGASWTINSLGMVEIAANRASAARRLGLRVGQRVAWNDDGVVRRRRSPGSR
jgi:S-adenosylmethionine hydrolase